MCGRFASSLPPERIREIFATLGVVPNHPPSWNVAPTQSALVVRRHPDTGERRLDALSWGLVPSFTKDPKGGRKPINARAETITSSGMFRGAFAAGRCVVPMDAFHGVGDDPDRQAALGVRPHPTPVLFEELDSGRLLPVPRFRIALGIRSLLAFVLAVLGAAEPSLSLGACFGTGRIWADGVGVHEVSPSVRDQSMGAGRAVGRTDDGRLC